MLLASNEELFTFYKLDGLKWEDYITKETHDNTKNTVSLPESLLVSVYEKEES